MQVRAWETRGFFHVNSKQLILGSSGDFGPQDLSLACKFDSSINEAKCKVLSDNLSRECGTFDISRDFTGKVVYSS